MTTGSGGPPNGNYPPPYPPQQPQGPYTPPGQYPQQYPQQFPPQYPQQYPPENLGYYGGMYPGQDTSGKATTSLVLGCIGLLGWCLPIVGVPITIVGLVFGLKGLNSSKRGTAIAGIVLNILCLFASVVNAGIGAYMGATGQLHPWGK